jgi:hypothetical protein
MDNSQQKQSTRRPIAVLSADIHYNLNTMHVADECVRSAIKLANDLNVPFISNGDLLDQKALMRAEYVNMIIETIKLCKVKPIINIGNHSRINEKSEEHALNFLKPYAYIVEESSCFNNFYIIPYQHDANEVREILKGIPLGGIVLMHQGINGSDAGEYIQDKSAINQEDVADYRVIAGHYHKRQDIKCGRPRKNSVGLFSYLGNPYTLGFGEADHGPKGFSILHEDGSLKFIESNVRRHITFNTEIKGGRYLTTGTYNLKDVRPIDLVKVKLTGTREELAKVDKTKLENVLNLRNIRLELIPKDINLKIDNKPKLSQNETLDEIITSLENTSIEQKDRLKQLWRDVCK